MNLTRVSPPQALPIHLDELKDAARIDHTEHDAQLTAYLAEATDKLDGYSGLLGRALVEQTWRLKLPCWPQRVRLPLLPVLSVARVGYFDSLGVGKTFAEWRLVEADGWSWVEPETDSSWPTTAARSDAIEIDFVAGYGAPGDVPPTLRGAIQLYAARRYDGEPVGDAIEMAMHYKVHSV